MKPVSIVWLSQRRIVRADFRANRNGVSLVRLEEAARPNSDDIGTLVDAALRLSKSKAKRVWVLSSEITANVLAVPQDVLQGVPDADLPQSLGFEAETVTGLSAFECLLSHQALPGTPEDRRFWFSQMPRAQHDRLHEAVRNYGAQFLGVTHPAAIRVPVNSEAGNSPWRRVELWEGLAVAVSSLDVEVLSTGSSLRRGFSDAWTRDPETTEVLVDDPDDSASQFNLATSTFLPTWLTAWAQELAKPQSSLPMLKPPPQPMSSGMRTSISVALAALVMLVCLGINLGNRARIRSLAVDLEKLQAPGKALAEIEKEIAAETKKKTELQTKQTVTARDVDLLKGTVERQRYRTARILELLASHAMKDVMIQQIAATGGETRVLGLCLQTDSVHVLSQRLGDGLAASSLDVLPAELTATSQRADGGPWKFAIVIRERAALKVVASQ